MKFHIMKFPPLYSYFLLKSLDLPTDTNRFLRRSVLVGYIGILKAEVY
jgi:hypothetical protein